MLIEEKKDNSFEVKNTPCEGANAASADATQKRLTIDAKTAAGYLGIAYWTLLELCKRGEIPYIPVGNRKLFRKETLTTWLTEREAGTTKQ